MAKALPDASILIDLFNEVDGAVAFAASQRGSDWLLHPVVEVEVLVGASDRAELKRIERRLNQLPTASLDPSDFDHCRAFVKRYTLSHDIGWPDCLIAATALRLGVPVVTLNDKHYRPIRGLRVIRPY